MAASEHDDLEGGARRRIGPAALAISAMGWALLSFSSAHAFERRDAFVVRWGSFDVARIDAAFALEQESYRIVWRTRAAGLLSLIFDFASMGEARGRIVDGAVRPVSINSATYADAKQGRVQVRFANDGSPSFLDVVFRDENEREPVPAALRRAPDPSAFAVDAFIAMAPGYERSADTFDGKRVMRNAVRCDVAPAHDRAGLEPMGDRLPLLCAFETRMIAGRYNKWEPDEEAEADKPRTVRAWLEPLAEAPHYWPSSIEADTPWGAVTIERASWEPAPKDWPVALSPLPELVGAN